MKKFLLLSCMCLAFGSELYSQNETKNTSDWKFTGQAQIRTEYDGRDFNNDTYLYNFTSSRIRFAAEKTIFNDVTGFIQMQDSRQLGSENNTIANSKNLDLHQGYIRIDNVFNAPIWVQAGRFKMKYGTERWISYNEFSYISRAFDGIRGGYKSEDVNVDVFSMIISPAGDIVSTGDPSKYPYYAKDDLSIRATGAYGDFKLNKSHKLSLMMLKEGMNPGYLDRYTAGLSYYYNYYGFKALAEFAYQFGTLSNTDIAAYNFALEASYNFDPIKVGATIDMFSGAKWEDKEIKAFVRPFGAGHKFFGYMDYFPAIFSKAFVNPGLNDFVLNFEYKTPDKPFYINADLHYFMTNVEYEMKDTKKSSAVGQEIDLKFGYQVVKGAVLELGASAFFAGDVMKDAFKTTEGERTDPGVWTYLQLKVDL